MSSETERVAERYEKRKISTIVSKNKNFLYSHFIQSERDLRYTEILSSYFENLSAIKLIEIGAGNGNNLFHFKKLGLQWSHIYANELLTDRFEDLQKNVPNITSFQGDACAIPSKYNNYFDVVHQSTVFTSILDHSFKKTLADKLFQITKPEGIVLWYDFTFDNPKNKDVKGIKRKEIKELFPQAKSITFFKTTLAPPIGRKVKKMYGFFNMFSFFRTHLVAVIEK